MTCPEQSGEEAILKLMAYVDGELDEAGSAEVREHLARCPSCREEAETVGGLGLRIRGAFPERAQGTPEVAKGRIRNALERHMNATETGGGRRARVLRIASRVGAAAVLAAAVLLVAGLVVGIFPDPAAADLAKDHQGCIGMRDDWVTEPTKIATILSREIGTGVVPIRLEAAGYSLRGALVCEVHGRRYVHLGFVAPGRPPASVFVAVSEPRSRFMKTETLVPGQMRVEVVRIDGRPGTEYVLVSAPDDEATLSRLVREQLRG